MIESGAYATRDVTGDIVVQFFELRTLRATTSNWTTGSDLVKTECPAEQIDKLCDIMGYAHVAIEAGQVCASL